MGSPVIKRPKALGHQLGVDAGLDQVAGGGHLRAGFFAVDIAARVRGRGIELQGVQQKIVRVRHAEATEDGKMAFQYTE